jgi:hypothetical protein
MNSRARGVRGNFKRGLSSSQCTQGQWQRNRVNRASFQPSEERTTNCSSDLAMIRTTFNVCFQGQSGKHLLIELFRF